MNLQDCITFANLNPICYFATASGKQPHVRAMGMWFADESGFYFQTGLMKDMSQEIKHNPNVEICFYKHDTHLGSMLRINGKVELLNDRKLVGRVLNDRPFLKDFGMTIESSTILLFRIAHGHAHFWTTENNLKEKEIIEF